MDNTATEICYDEPYSAAGPDDLNPHDSLVYFSSYRDYDAESDLSYGDLYPCSNRGVYSESALFVLPHLLAGSDYSGGAVTVSNHRLFLAEFGELDGVHDVYGGHGSYGVAVRVDVWNSGRESCESCDGSCAHQMREWLAALEDYPVADEQDLAEIELESENEAWESWAERDFIDTVRQRFPEDIEEFEVTDSERFREWFEELRERANVYWENETGNSAHVDIARVAAELEDVGSVIEASEETGTDGEPRYGFTLELLRRVSYLPYCKTCGLLISAQESATQAEALRRVRARSGAPSHLKHARLALEKVVYAASEGE